MVWRKTEELLTAFYENTDKASREEVTGYVYFYEREDVQIDSNVDPLVIQSLRLAEFYPIDIRKVFPMLYETEDCTQKYESLNKTIDEYFSMLETCSQYQFQV